VTGDGRRDVVPLRVWAGSFFIAGLIVWAGFGLFAQKYKDIETVRQFGRNLHPGCPRTEAYILGSSLMEKGVSAYGSLDSILNRDRVEINYKLLFRSCAVISDFSPFLEEIIKTGPCIVVIESNILCADLSMRPPVSFVGSLRWYWTYLRNIPNRLTWSLFERASRLSRNPEPFKFALRQRTIDEKFWAAYKKRAKKYRARKIDAFPEWNAFFTRARGAGIRIVLLELPRSLEAARYVPERFLEDEKELIGRFEERYGVTHLKFPRRLEQRKYYVDEAHFNREGARVFSRWIADLVAEYVGNRGR
jgi:hypothetical protein